MNSSAEVFEVREVGRIIFLIPLVTIFFISPFFFSSDNEELNILPHQVNSGKKSYGFSALIAPEIFSKNLRDTIYTNDDLWLEFRIDQQMLYVHFRDGRIIKYPVSSGIPGAHKSVDSRPGLFAIFHKAETHKSSQFQSQLNYFMPFNMGIGFHGLQGTGYYVHLGIRPSSHGCVRMRNEDARELFKICRIGTLVLAHKGKTARVIAFAPEGFRNEVEYSKDDYMNMMAYNLSSIMEGKYFINPPKRFILDGSVIPKIGINIGSSDNIPEKQELPFAVFHVETIRDKLGVQLVNLLNSSEISDLAFNFDYEDSGLASSNLDISVSQEMIKKYVHNPLGILPYFPPDR